MKNAMVVILKGVIKMALLPLGIVSEMYVTYKNIKAKEAMNQFVGTLINVQTVEWAKNYKLANGVVVY